MNKVLISLLLASAVVVTPAYANYFSTNSQGWHRNIGSAPDQKARQVVVSQFDAPDYGDLSPSFTLPALPPVVLTFVVLFDFDQSELTPEAQQIVALAVTTARGTGMVRVLVTGHADAVGTELYNQTLSENRAGAVKAEIERLGLNGLDVSTIGKSYSEPLEQSRQGVPEPQDRRAVIELGFDPMAGTVLGTVGE